MGQQLQHYRNATSVGLVCKATHRSIADQQPNYSNIVGSEDHQQQQFRTSPSTGNKDESDDLFIFIFYEQQPPIHYIYLWPTTKEKTQQWLKIHNDKTL